MPLVIYCAEDGSLRKNDEIAHIIRTKEISKVEEKLAETQNKVNSEVLCAFGFVAYEAAPAFDDALQTKEGSDALPLLYFALFNEKDSYPYTPKEPDEGFSIKLSDAPDYNDFQNDFEKIKIALKEGRSYQVNYSYRLNSTSVKSCAQDIFQFMYAKQPTPYAAMIDEDDFAVISASPELFFSLKDGVIESRPMKGTAARACTNGEDAIVRQRLIEDDKTRAENLMICDMIRNDLGHISRFGTVHCPALFETERYPSVWQMTSTVRSKLMPKADLCAVFESLFPCASITGAPKVETMKLIKALEKDARGIYCGAIGMIKPGGDAVFSVAIRTLSLNKVSQQAEYGTGAGIVWDSECRAEYEECITKSSFVRLPYKGFYIFETLLYEDGSFFLADEHKARIKDSARYFAFPFDGERYDSLLKGSVEGRKPNKRYKVRIKLYKDGSMSAGKAEEVQSSSKDKCAVAKQRIDSSEVSVYHKTSERDRINASRENMGADVYDMLFFNERGELCEGGITNVFLEIEGRLFTPPISCGLLAGTMRSYLIRSGQAKERVLYEKDLRGAAKILLSNSVIKLKEVFLVQ